MKILSIATNKININLFLATSFIGLFWLQIKHQLLNGSSGLTAFARMLGLERNGLDFFGVLSLYISDFLVCSLLIPIILSYISKNLSTKIQRVFFNFTNFITTTILLYIQRNIGKCWRLH